LNRLIENEGTIRPAYEQRVDELKASASEGYRVFVERYL